MDEGHDEERHDDERHDEENVGGRDDRSTDKIHGRFDPGALNVRPPLPRASKASIGR
jgi:hypothetical protein